ncbi:MAG: D-alanyl-D-alanine carboxypeptidase [Magnetococcales bacterium]|nr:D-alanyl-D-alanine carboxypeptidase [Magnetococcales bacterium]
MMINYKSSILPWILVLLLIPFSVDATEGRSRLIDKSSFTLSSNKVKPKPSKQTAKRSSNKRKKAVRSSNAVINDPANYADLVMDAKTGRILHATDPDELRHPASLTKMMTLYLTFQGLRSGRLHLNDFLPISQIASNQEPSRLGLRPGRQIRVEDALLGLVTKSANDATVVLAEAMGGSIDGFATMMTNKARELGMKRTVFCNPSGLPNPKQVTTARDMAILGYALIHHFPEFYPYFSREKFSYAGVTHRNHNRLMSRYPGMDGIKTGYIRASGFNLVASTVRGSTRLIAVVFGGRSALSRDNKMAALLDQSFAQLQNGKPERRVNTADGSDRIPTEQVMASSTITADWTTPQPQPVTPPLSAMPQPVQSVVADKPEQESVADEGTQVVKVNDKAHYKDIYTLSAGFVGMVGVLIFWKQRRYPYIVKT